MASKQVSEGAVALTVKGISLVSLGHKEAEAQDRSSGHIDSPG